MSEFILATLGKREAELHRKLASECGYTTDRDVAASQVVKKRGLISISAEGQSVLQNVCGDAECLRGKQPDRKTSLV